MTMTVYDKRKRKVAPGKVLGLLLMVTILIGAVPIPTRAQTPHQIALNPSSGPRGTTVTVTVSSVGTTGSLNLYFNGAFVHSFSGPTPLVTDFIVPDVAPGPYPVRVTGWTQISGPGWSTGYPIDLTAMFEVIDTMPPAISAPTVTYEEGTTGHRLRWTLEDPDPGSYTLYNNSLPVRPSASWTTGETIECNIDGLPVGTYNFTLGVCDAYGSCTADTVWVEVVESSTPPPPAPATLFSEMLWMLPLALLAGTFIIRRRRK